MSIMTMILGESGTGKTTSLRNLNSEEVLLIRSIAKLLPFKNKWQKLDKGNPTGSIFTSDSSKQICSFLHSRPEKMPNRKIIILDDFQYIMANEFFARSLEKGYDKFAEMGKHTFDIINAAQALPDDYRVYFLWHTETDPFGKVKAKTIGKMLDEKYTPEGAFTIALRTQVENKQYYFSTQNNGSDTVKSPMGMFESDLITNDLLIVDDAICDYYNISKGN